MNETITSAEFADQTPNPEALDSRWFPAFESAGAFEASSYYTLDDEQRDSQKAEFLSSSENPHFEYKNIDLTDLDQKESDLLDLKSTILQLEGNETVRQVYRWRINEKIAEIRMVKASAAGDMRKFEHYNYFINGNPDQGVYAYTVQSIRDRFAPFVTSEDAEVQKAAQDLLAVLPEVDAPEVSKPSQETHEQVKSFVKSEFKKYGISLPDDIDEYTDEQFKETIETALEALGAEGWKAILTDERTGLFTNQDARTVEVPEDKSTKRLKAKQLIAHEVLTHVQRRINGEQSKLSLLGLGLDRSLRGEEGVATLKEQGWSKNFADFKGLEPHLAIALAKGLDGKPRDFREVFNIMQKYFCIMHMSKGVGKEEATKKATEAAWNRCIRTFRGTDCKTPGICYTKDIVYREGNIAVWDVVSENPDEMIKFSIGKYDPSNPRHIWILTQLGITEADLEK